MDKTNSSSDERPKKSIAKKVVTPKRRYFFPDQGVSVEATSHKEALKLVGKKAKDGDV